MHTRRTPTRLILVAALAIAALARSADAYQLRFGVDIGAGCDFRGGWYVTTIGPRLFAGGPWDMDDCGREAYGLRVYDLATGAFDRELLGTYAAAAAGPHLVLGHVDAVQVVDPTTFAVDHTIPPPAGAGASLTLLGAVADDVLAVGDGDAPETADRRVVYRLAAATGSVVQRYVAPQPDGATVIDAAAGDGLVAVGVLPLGGSGGSAGGVFVFGADDGVLRWSASVPAGAWSARVGHAVAIAHGQVLVGVPPLFPATRGEVHVFAADTGAPVRTLMAPLGAATGPDGFGRAVAAGGGLIVVGARGIGDDARPGGAYVFDAASGAQLDVLTAPSEVPIGDAVALGDGVIVVAGNEEDGAVRVFEEGDACTVDACVAGACDPSALADRAAAVCQVARWRGDVACAGARIARRLDKRLARVAALLGAIETAPSARQTRIAARIARRGAAHCRVVGRVAVRLAPDCAERLALGCDRSPVLDVGS